MSEHKDYRTEIDDWAAMWDEMQASGVHPAPEKPKPSPFAADVLGMRAQDTYYDYFDSQDDYAPAEDDEGLLQEEKTPNPVYPDSVGPDNEGPKAAWVNEKLLKEVEFLKKRLFQVENKMARMGQGKKWTEKAVVQGDGDKLMSEIRALRKRIDRVSNTLGIKDEPSPWQIKRD